MPSIKGTYFAWTLFNYDNGAIEALRKSLTADSVRYAVFGYEKTKDGKPHLQGYIAFKKQTTFPTAKALLGREAHLEVCKGNEVQNIDYCTKDGEFEEFGEKTTKPGKRCDLEAFMQTVKDGCTDLKRLREEHPRVLAKYPRFVGDYIRDQIADPEIDPHPLREWQEDLNVLLKRPADSRTVVFIVDPIGNQGKTWFSKYYCNLHEDAMILRPTKHADMAYALPPTLRVLFLDCTRKQVEYMPYTFMEECKDGYVFSNKYESCVKKFAPMHVVVLMNQEPDRTALSADRYVVISLK